MSEGISSIDLSFRGQTGHYSGKVREVFEFEDKMALVATDRISAFDVILPAPIPYKGQVLNQMAAYFLKASTDVVPNWFEDTPHPNVSIGKKCVPFPVEMVVRRYLTGHAWRIYKEGHRTLCGESLPDGLKEHDPLPKPIITPTTKAHEGHDEDISKDEIIRQHLVRGQHYEKLEHYSLALFQQGTKMADDRGLILVDTKYEFGRYDNKIYLIDEVHTPDSSRYFYKDTYEQLQHAGKPQKQLSKEFVREWLMQEGFQGKAGQTIPDMPPERISAISNRYIELFEKITGNTFVKDSYDGKLEKIKTSIINALDL